MDGEGARLNRRESLPGSRYGTWRNRRCRLAVPFASLSRDSGLQEIRREKGAKQPAGLATVLASGQRLDLSNVVQLWLKENAEFTIAQMIPLLHERLTPALLSAKMSLYR